MEDNEYTIIHVASGEAWAAGAATNGLVAVGDGGLALAGEMVHGLDRRLGLAGRIRPDALVADRCGTLIMLAGERFYRLDAMSGRLERIPCLGGRGSRGGELSGPRAMALGSSNLYVADTDNNRVCVFATVNWQVRRFIGAENPAGEPAAGSGPGEFDRPLDLAVDPCGNLYVLDAGNRRIQRFDHHGEPVPHVPPFGADRLKQPVALALGPASSPSGGGSLVHCLDTGLTAIVTFDDQGRFLGTVGLDDLGFEPAGLAVDADGKWYVSDRERFMYAVRSTGDWSPLEEYEGKALRLFSGPGGEFYALEDGEVARLTRRRRYPPAGSWTGSGPVTGIYTSRSYDTGDGRLLWHRVTLDATVPPKTQVRLSYFIYETGRDPSLLPADGEWLSFPSNPADALFERKEGRYLRVRLELVSEDRHATPTVASLRLQFPKQSYLRYLPAVFQDDERGRDFLERFLSLFESVLYDLEREIFTTRRYADPWAVPAGFLPWLASWLALPDADQWLEDGGARLRTLIARANELYRFRGTRGGLAELISLYTGKEPWIVEAFQLDCIRGRSEWRETMRLFGEDPYHFTVLLQPGGSGRIETVKRIVARERPAHTCATVVALEPLFRLGGHTYLEVNTNLNQPLFALETSSSLARQTYLADGEKAGQAQVRARQGMDTLFE